MGVNPDRHADVTENRTVPDGESWDAVVPMTTDQPHPLASLEKAMNEFLTDALDPEYLIRERLHIEIAEAEQECIAREDAAREKVLEDLKTSQQRIIYQLDHDDFNQEGFPECCTRRHNDDIALMKSMTEDVIDKIESLRQHKEQL